MDSPRQDIFLNHDIFLAILCQLDLKDLLVVRRVCRALRDLTHERSIWTRHYAEMIRHRQLPTSTVDHNLSQLSMEAAVRRDILIESAWRRASPKMESLRFVTLSTSDHDWIGDMQRGFMVPGGKYFLIFVSYGAYVLSLEELSRTPVPFISLQDVNMEGLDVGTCRWTTGRPDDGSLTFYAAIKPADRAVRAEMSAFWSADFHVFPPTQTYHGQFSIPRFPRNARTKNELFMFNTDDGFHIIVFDWKALLQGGSFRYYVLHTRNRYEMPRSHGIHDFCLLPNGCILTIDSWSSSLVLYGPPDFRTVSHLNQPFTSEYITPLWRRDFGLTGGHMCDPLSIWSLPLCHPHTDTDDSSALICSKGRQCCYRVATGSEGLKLFDHHMLPAVFGRRFNPGRTWAMVTTPLVDEDGFRIGCIRYAPMMEWENDSLQSYGTFDIAAANLPGWASNTRLSSRFSASQVYFNEESGRICFLHAAVAQHEATIFVLDLI